MKDDPISIRFDKGVRKALQQLADSERRTLSDYIRLVLFQHVQDEHRKAGKVFHDHTPIRGGR